MRSLVQVDPQFAGASHADFKLSTGSAAHALGIREWDHSNVGPGCVLSDGGAADTIVWSSIDSHTGRPTRRDAHALASGVSFRK